MRKEQFTTLVTIKGYLSEALDFPDLEESVRTEAEEMHAEVIRHMSEDTYPDNADEILHFAAHLHGYT